LELLSATTADGLIAAFIILAMSFVSSFRRWPSTISAIAWSGPKHKAGGLMSCWLNKAETYRRMAVFVDDILKDTKPADLPVEPVGQQGP
jgi:hypothetical protein